jgi:hypothetical protein
VVPALDYYIFLDEKSPKLVTSGFEMTFYYASIRATIFIVVPKA